MPETLSLTQAMRYNRQIVLPQVDLSGQEALLSAKVLILGVGGLGCTAAQLLCSSGVGQLTLIDDDVVEQTNLPRQILFTDDQIGQKKVEAARHRLLNMNSECKVTTLDARPDDEQLMALINQHNIVIDCTDNLNSRRQINRLCYQQQVPLVIGAAIRFEGQIQIIDPSQHTACYHCVSQFISDTELSCTEAGIMAPVVTAIGNQQAMLAIMQLAGLGHPPYNTLITYDALHLQWQHYVVTPQPHCPVCGAAPTEAL